MENNWDKTVEILDGGGIGILPTDTIYGMVGSALIPEAVERIYQARKRDKDKPLIILISKMKDLALFGIHPDRSSEKILERLWPGEISVVLPCPNEKFKYLHRGGKTLAFRLPNKESLICLLKKTGPLVAPSANPEGDRPAGSISEAKNYFGNQVDFYIDEGITKSSPSSLVSLENSRLKILRKGRNIALDKIFKIC